MTVEQEEGVVTSACYGKWNWTVLPLLAVLVVVVVGLLGSPMVAFAQDPAPGYTEGIWIAHTPGNTAYFSGEGTSRIYWGKPGGHGKQSSYEFVGAALPTPMPLNTSFVLGTFTHYNFPISGPSLQSATLSVAIDFADPAWPDQTFSYVFEHEETPNSGTCAYCGGLPPGTTCIPCPDRVTFPTAYGEESFRIGDQLYTLKIDGFRRQISDPTMEYFVTQENEANSAYLYATVSSVLVPEPAISIIKETSGDQSSWGDGVYIAAGAPVYWRYIVQNTGNVELTGISVTDDKGVQVTCPKTVLAKGESMTCTASGTAVAGSYSNIGTVVGTTPAGTDPATVSDTDPSSYVGVGGLAVSKTATTTYTRTYTWGIDKSADGEYWKFIGEAPSTHSYTVAVERQASDSAWAVSGVITIKNTAPTEATITGVTDVVSDSISAAVDCGVTYPHRLAAGATLVCSYTASLPDASERINTVTVTTSGPVSGGTGTAKVVFGAPTTVVGPAEVTISDDKTGETWKASGSDSVTYSAEFSCPTDVTRYTNGVYQAPDFVNTATITETNQSDSATVKLTCYAPVVSKTAEGTYTKTHNWAIEKTVNPASQAGSPGDVLPWTWTVKVSETPSNSGFAVSGEITVVNPNGQAELAASLSDQLNDGTVGAISGCTGGTYDGGILTVPAGGTAVCGYSALPSGLASTNVATVTLNRIPFSGQATVRWTPSISNGTATVTDGQIGLNEVVTAGEGPWIRTGSGSHTCAAEDSGQYAATGSYGATVDNTATVTGSNGQTASADASTKYVCSIQAMPAIEIEKATNGEDADVAPGPYIPEGGAVTWRYVVTNTGNVDLTDVAVTDNMGVIPVYVSGDVNDDGILQVDETWVYEAGGTAIAGQYENLGAVTAAFAATGETVSDSDPSHYFGSAPAIEIEKATNGEDADAAPGPYIKVGDAVTWTYVVTNTGNVTLTDVAVTDDQGVVVSCPQATLAVGESMSCTASGTAVAGQYANIGAVSGTPPVGAAVTDEDPSHYFGSAPAIEIEKATNGEDADAAPGPSIPVGEAVSWTYVVTNTGNVDLTEVAVTDDRGVVVSCPQTTLAVGESMTCTGSGVAVAGQYVNEGTAVGSFGEVQVSDSDPSHYYGVVGGLKVTKEVELLQDAAQVVDPNMRFEICASGPSFSEPSCVQLKDGESHTWTGLIPGSYVVSETAPVHGLLSWAVEVVYEGGAEFATVVAEETAEVTVLNTADYQSPPTGIMVSEWEATVGQSGVLHTWRTIGEEDVSGFRVYRGSVGSIGEAELVGEVVAQGPSVYQWVDGEVSLGTWYYWLVEVDSRGEEGESIGPKTVTVGLGGQDNRNQRIYLPMTLLRG